jgi:hypothetical protein
MTFAGQSREGRRELENAADFPAARHLLWLVLEFQK